jgi:hypothetical protein
MRVHQQNHKPIRIKVRMKPNETICPNCYIVIETIGYCPNCVINKNQ